MTLEQLFGSGFGLAIVFFAIVLALLWFLLPFAVFGIKDRLSTMIVETRATNTALAALGAQLADLKADALRVAGERAVARQAALAPKPSF